ncbi:ADP-ribosylation/Crystallin J1 [Psychromonas ingrahamii 37]|uniref:ADP-ribosylation/Crystallin J1 n=1 Tax=Psychromonas ingrahamii (strain DSM 17664 / CCUG 51855 / 37) TaxID=357804 RepID=A1SW16_PSYIN|nr:ADP-ribosylglycohydrolase family protein [Psychromonas ingrahamii]ABM03681.1 ADP-ribosylation/Crystallin J1 [Psychromonas ingrahamii 37]
MLLVIAMADAYGAGFEFTENEYIKENHCLTKYHQICLDKKSTGCYTDDTQMSIAIAELMVNESGPWNANLVAEYFLKAFKRDPRQSYSEEFYNFLLNTETSNEFIENIYADSIRNGSAMRSVPLGLIKDKTEMLEKARIQASVTHDSYEGIVASQAVALAVYYFVNQLGKKEGLFDYVCQQTNEIFQRDKTSRTECNAIETIDAVLTVLSQSDSLTEVLDKSVNLGGDTDSVACIACGIAFFSDEYVKNLPDFLERDIENGPYGKDYLIKLSENLSSL